MNSRVPNRIKELRGDMSVRELAEKCGFSDHMKVHRAETGHPGTTLETMRRIADALERKLSELFNDEDVEFRPDVDGQAFLTAFDRIPPAMRAHATVAAFEVARVVAGMAVSQTLPGNSATLAELADVWRGYDEPGRERAVELLKLARRG